VCTFPDFAKIMAYEAAEDNSNKATDYLEIYAQMLETKLTCFGFQVGKNVNVDNLMGQNKVLINEDRSNDMQSFV
jgi:hypothetical protein